MAVPSSRTKLLVLLLVLPAALSLPVNDEQETKGRRSFGGGIHIHRDIDINFHKPSLLHNILHRPKHTIIQHQTPVITTGNIQFQQTGVQGIIHPQQTTEFVQIVQPQQTTGFVEQQNTLQFTQPQQTTGFVEQQHTVQYTQPQQTTGFIEQQRSVQYTQPQLTNGFVSQQQIQTTGSNQFITGGTLTGNTRVVEEEHEQVIDQVKQHIIEEHIPTIIKTKTPTYIQETVQQQVIREKVPSMVQEQHTEYVTETKPIYVTETKPVTKTVNKVVMTERERLVNVPGQTIITKGPTTVTSQQGVSQMNLVGHSSFHSQQIGLRSAFDETETIKNNEAVNEVVDDKKASVVAEDVALEGVKASDLAIQEALLINGLDMTSAEGNQKLEELYNEIIKKESDLPKTGVKHRKAYSLDVDDLDDVDEDFNHEETSRKLHHKKHSHKGGKHSRHHRKHSS